MINSGDIVNYQSDIWLSQEYILKHCGISNEYLRVAKTRAKSGKTQSWQHTQILNRCYFSYSALPRTAGNRLPSLNELINNASEVHNDVRTIITAATISRYKLYTSAMSPELAKAAAVIHEASIFVKQNGISYSKSPFFERLATEIEVSGLKYLPTTWRNLRDKIRDFAAGTSMTELVKAKNEGNQNRVLYANNELIQGWIVEMADSQKNYSYAFMWRKLQTICAQYQITTVPSQRWVSDFLAQPKTQYLIEQRYGANTRFNHKYRGYTPTESALFAGDCWDIDGTRVNIIDHRGTWTDPKTGKKLHGQKFLYIIGVRDVMSGMVLGYEYCYEESAQAVINALAMAVNNTGYLPYELRYDRFPGHNTAEWQYVESAMQRMGVITTQTVKAEGKAHVERWWGTLQSVFMMESDYYYGEGVKSTRRSAHRSKEYVTAMRQQAMKAGFDFDAATRETDRILDGYISTKLSSYSRKYAKIDKSPLQLHDESDKPNVFEVEDHTQAYLFGLRKGVSIRNNMIQTQIDNATFYYGIDDVEVIERYTGVKLTNCFDLNDLDRVHLYDGETYLGTFCQVTPAQQYGPDKDMRAVGKLKAINEQVKTHRAAKKSELNRAKIELEQAADEVRATLSGCPDDEPESVPGEIGILQSGRIRKHDYEASETAYLREEWGDEEEVKINIRNQY